MTVWTPDLGGRPPPRYVAIADALANDIARGTLSPGERLPTHRDLAYRISVTVGTVSRAYAEAEHRGLISGEVGRGTFVQAENRQPATSAFTTFSAADNSKPGFVDLGLNTPADGERGARLARTLGELAQAPDVESLLRLMPDMGTARHRAAGASWMAKLGVDAAPERTVVCNGTQHAMTAIFGALLKPGDTVLTEELTYPGMKTLAGFLHLRLVGLPMDEEGLRPDALAEACRNGGARVLYCMPNYQNPTTACMGPARRAAIATIARDHDLMVIEDDVCGFLKTDPVSPIVQEIPERTCYITGLSKIVGLGLRVGYALVPERLVEPVAAAVRATCWMAAPLGAEIAARWINDGTIDELIPWHRREAAARQDVARRILGHLNFRCAPGSYHLWLELPAPWRGDELVDAARMRDVGLISVEPFLVGRGAMPHALRLTLGQPTRPDLERGLQVIADILAGPLRPTAAVM